MLATLPVTAPLRAIVDGIWTFTGRDQLHRVLPDGCLDFIFNLASGSAAIVGPMSRALVVPVRAGVTSFGVRFRPGHAARFIDAKASELLDGQAALAMLTRFSDLPERIAEAQSHAARADVLERALLDSRPRLRAADAHVERAVMLVRRTVGRVSVSALAASVGLSERQLERRFLERVGLAPKRFARSVRFERALVLVRAGRESRAEIALRSGYSDEPHLLRDFRALSGLTPTALQRERASAQARDVGFVQDEAEDSR